MSQITSLLLVISGHKCIELINPLLIGSWCEEERAQSVVTNRHGCAGGELVRQDHPPHKQSPVPRKPGTSLPLTEYCLNSHCFDLDTLSVKTVVPQGKCLVNRNNKTLFLRSMFVSDGEGTRAAAISHRRCNAKSQQRRRRHHRRSAERSQKRDVQRRCIHRGGAARFIRHR